MNRIHYFLVSLFLMSALHDLRAVKLPTALEHMAMQLDADTTCAREIHYFKRLKECGRDKQCRTKLTEEWRACSGKKFRKLYQEKIKELNKNG